MNIYEIKRLTKENLPFLFSAQTLRFFGQTMRSFKVKTSPNGRVFIYAPSYWDDKLMGYTFREYKDGNLLTVNREGKFPGWDTAEEIEKFIKEN